jgi:hypothetical protein
MAGPMASGGHGDSHGGGKAEEHITSMSTCYGDKLGVTQLKKGQKWLLEAYYDYNKYVFLITIIKDDHTDQDNQTSWDENRKRKAVKCDGNFSW